MPDSYLVIGGSGFLGGHIVDALLARGEAQVAVFDVVQRYFIDKVAFFSGDITSEEQVSDAIHKCQATCIIHTASPHPESPKEVLEKVNVEGARIVVKAAAANGVSKLVYTSSAGVVFNRNDVTDLDERLDYPPGLDAYNQTKADGEKVVLEANGKEGLATCALRPAGIFGPRDRQAVPGIIAGIERGQTKMQIGSNTNIFDWTYVDNVVKAHLLAADKLSLTAAPLTADDLAVALPSIDLTIPPRRIPTSVAKPVGPSADPTEEELEAEKAFRDPTTLQARPLLRTKFDALSPTSLGTDYTTTPLVVAGQAFFISGGEPLYFWDFVRSIWKYCGTEVDTKKVWVFPKWLGLLMGQASEFVASVRGKDTNFTRYRVHYLCATRWHNIEKARRVLGYEPEVGVEEGIKRTVQWWLEDQKKTAKEKIAS